MYLDQIFTQNFETILAIIHRRSAQVNELSGNDRHNAHNVWKTEASME